MSARYVVCLVLALLFAAPCLAAGEAGTVPLDQALPLPIMRSVTDIAVFNSDTGAVRWLKLLEDVEPAAAAARLSTFFDRPVPPDTLRVIQVRDGELTCNCAGLLGVGEFLVSEQPIRDGTGRYVSINDEAFKALCELIDYPLTDPELVAVMLSELAYVNNDDAIRRFLVARGFEVILTHGFLNAKVLNRTLTIPFFLVRHPPTAAAYLSVRGTAEVSDLRTNLEAVLVPWAADAGLVHKGFFDAANDVIALIRPALEDLHRNDPTMPVYTVGHSLGAAVSAMVTLKLVGALPTLRTIGFAPPPLGNRGFVEAMKSNVGDITGFFVPHDEIRTLGDLSRISKLEWLGTEKVLDDVGPTAKRYHYVINYLKGVLKSHGRSVSDYERSLPVCVLYKTPCFVGWRENVISSCVLDDPRCVQRRWPDLQRWLDRDGKPEAGSRNRLDELKIRMLRDSPPSYIVPLVYMTMARLAAELGGAQEALGYVTASERLSGTRSLYTAMRARLAAND